MRCTHKRSPTGRAAERTPHRRLLYDNGPEFNCWKIGQVLNDRRAPADRVIPIVTRRSSVNFGNRTVAAVNWSCNVYRGESRSDGRSLTVKQNDQIHCAQTEGIYLFRLIELPSGKSLLCGREKARWRPATTWRPFFMRRRVFDRHWICDRNL